MKGFTLIETLIYIALFSLLLVGGFTAAFSLVESSSMLNSRKVTIEESNFVIRKVNWLLSNADTVTSTLNSLTVTDYDGNDSVVTITSDKVTLNGTPLTTENVEVESLEFETIAGTPLGITTVLTLDGITSTSTKYLKK